MNSDFLTIGFDKRVLQVTQRNGMTIIFNVSLSYFNLRPTMSIVLTNNTQCNELND